MLEKDGKPSMGILNLRAGEQKFLLSRIPPSADLSFFVQRYWIVRWDLRGQPPYRQEVISHPCVNLVFEKGKTRIYGIEKEMSSQLLKNEGKVFGVKFKPGAFYPFLKSPLSELTGSSLSFREVFGVDSAPLENAILALDDEGKMVELAETFLRERLPERDEYVALINRIVERIMSDREITKVDDIVDQFNINKRRLQRLFNQYVGVSPKWVIKRYRLHEAAEQMANGDIPDWPNLVIDLGYFDQAHFIKDFKTIVGRSPEEYTKKIGDITDVTKKT